MFSADGRYVIVFNGEIYNHMEIRNVYLKDVVFKSTGDTETVLYAFIQLGEKIFEILRELSCNIIWIQTTPVIDKIHNSIKKEFNRFNKDVIAYNKVSKKITLSNGALLLDLYEFTKALGGTEIYKDHVHFICEIRKLQAAYIAGHIQTLMNLPLK